MSSISRNLFILLFSLSSAVAAQDQCGQLAKIVAQNNYSEAFELVASMPNPDDATCSNLVGKVYLQKGQVEKAISFFENALNDPGNEDEKASSLNNLAIAHWTLGHFTQASSLMKEAVNLRKSENQPEKLAAALNDLGLIYSAINKDVALLHYEKALQLYRDLAEPDQEKIAQLLLNIGIIYRDIEFFGDAVMNQEDALAMIQEIYPEGHPTEAFINFVLGQTHTSMDMVEPALAFYQKALEIYIAKIGEFHPDVARTYTAIGNLYNAQGEFELALGYYQKSLIANSPSFRSANLEDNPPVREYLSANTLLNTLYYKGKAFEDFHFNHSLDFKDLKSSLSAFQSCDSLIDVIRQVTSNEADKIALGDLSAQVYESGVRVSYAMATVSLKKQEYYEQAFFFAEKSKSAVLLEAISDAAAKSYANIPANAVEKEAELKASIAYYEKQAAENPGDTEISRQLVQYRADYRDFVRQLEREFPQYFNLKYNVQIPGIEEVQKALDDQTALVSYFLAGETNRLYVFTLSNDKIKVDNVAQTENFDGYLSGFRYSIYYRIDDIYKLTGEWLYDLLFPSSIPKGVTNLVIIPAGRLGTIPFEALLTDNVKDKDFIYESLPYLIRDYNVSYHFASTLFIQNSENLQSLERKALLCAPVLFSRYQDLPGTDQEVKDLGEIFASRSVDATILMKQDAGESAFKSQDLAQYSHLHFATHGFVDEYRPQLSRISLWDSPDQEDDGQLYSGEIYNLNLKADLVTLSACETGLGKVSQGEGIIGLSRALLYAGARNVVVSLWNVADQSTADFMSIFYGDTQQGLSTALRNAKLSIIAGDYSHPYYWAPFVLIGN